MRSRRMRNRRPPRPPRPTLLTYTLKNTHDFHPKTTYLLTKTWLARRFTTLGTHLHRNTWQYAHTGEKSHWFGASVCALRWPGHERSICVGRDGDAHRKREFCEGQWVLCITFILNLLALTLGRLIEWFLKICRILYLLLFCISSSNR